MKHVIWDLQWKTTLIVKDIQATDTILILMDTIHILMDTIRILMDTIRILMDTICILMDTVCILILLISQRATNHRGMISSQTNGREL